MTVTTVPLWRPCWLIATSACPSVLLKSALMENQRGGCVRQLACSRVIALMCELCGGGRVINRHDSIMASTLITVYCEYEEVMPMFINIRTPINGDFHNYFFLF